VIARGNMQEAEVTGGKHRRGTVVPIRPEVLARIMNDPAAAKRTPFDPSARGYSAVYRSGDVNHCPGCGRSNWWVGRQLAECAFCATAIPMAE